MIEMHFGESKQLSDSHLSLTGTACTGNQVWELDAKVKWNNT